MDYYKMLSSKDIEDKLNSEYFTDDELEQYYISIKEDDTEELNFDHKDI